MNLQTFKFKGTLRFEITKLGVELMLVDVKGNMTPLFKRVELVVSRYPDKKFKLHFIAADEPTPEVELKEMVIKRFAGVPDVKPMYAYEAHTFVGSDEYEVVRERLMEEMASLQSKYVVVEMKLKPE